jgi:hypothetical protein
MASQLCWIGEMPYGSAFEGLLIDAAANWEKFAVKWNVMVD